MTLQPQRESLLIALERPARRRPTADVDSRAGPRSCASELSASRSIAAPHCSRAAHHVRPCVDAHVEAKLTRPAARKPATAVKVVTLGQSAAGASMAASSRLIEAGKSSLVLRFVRDEFAENQESTIGAALCVDSMYRAI